MGYILLYLIPKYKRRWRIFQSKLLRGLLAVPKSCPIPALTHESDILQMKYRLYAKVLNFTKHILCQDEVTSLAKQVLNEQIAQEWPGLASDAALICEELKLTGLIDPMVTKKQFKVSV